jgi:hypothetical protein
MTMACGLLPGEGRMERVAKVFWLTTVVAAAVAFLTQPGPLRWAAIGWLALIGLTFALGNWIISAAWISGRGTGSSVPLLGVLFLGIALAAVPPDLIRRWMIWGLFLDPWPWTVALCPIARLFEREPSDSRCS